jgi:hypothetical protein
MHIHTHICMHIQMKLLVAHGADVRSNDGYALLLAAESGKHHAVRLLIQLGADLNENGAEIIKIAAENRHLEVVKVLVKHGVDYREAGLDYTYEELVDAIFHRQIPVLDKDEFLSISFESLNGGPEPPEPEPPERDDVDAEVVTFVKPGIYIYIYMYIYVYIYTHLCRHLLKTNEERNLAACMRPCTYMYKYVYM